MGGPDVVVVGAGHNGLVCACHLAAGGRRVLVLEARKEVGGLCAGREFHPGYTAPGILHDASTFRPAIADELRLSKAGLATGDHLPILLAAPGRPGIVLDRDPDRDPASEPLRAWRALLERVGPVIRKLLDRPPPRLVPRSAGDLLDLGLRGLALRRLGRADMLELLRILPMCVADWLRESFEDDALVEGLAAPAVLGTYLGPWSAGSAANLVFHEATAGRPYPGGPAAVTEALRTRASQLGVEIRTGTAVAGLRVEGGRVAGVVVEGGDAIDAGRVAATCDPRHLLALCPPGTLPIELEGALTSFRCRGTLAKVHLALDGPLEAAGREGERFEFLRVGGGTVDDLERAFDDAKYRRLPAAPALDVRVPTVSAPDLAPAGGHVVSILAGFVPADLSGGWSDEARDEIGRRVVDRLAAVAPSLPGRIVGSEVLTPADLEAEFRLTGGHLDHGEHALDQLLFMRPAPAVARYRTPIEGLFLAGSGSHPGGGVTGVPGRLAADAIESQ